MPEREADGEHSQANVKDAPVTNNIAQELFTLQSLLYIFERQHMLLSARDQGTGLCERALAIGDEAILRIVAAQLLWRLLHRDIRQVPGCLQYRPLVALSGS